MLRTSRAARFIGLGLTTSLVVLGLGLPTPEAGASPASASKNWTINLENFVPATPTFAYPLMDGADFTQSNGSLQQGMYRPLYWYGTSTGAVAVNPKLSLAYAPKMSNGGRTATITLKKGYKWSNGAPVQAKDVMEFLNLYAAFPSWYGNYSAPVNNRPISIPDTIKSAYAPNATTVVMNFVAPVSTTWLELNPLSEITPMPQAWDVIPKNWSPQNPYSPNSLVTKAGGNLATKYAGCWGANFIGDGNTTGPTTTFKDPNGTNTIIPAHNVTWAKRCVEVIATMAAFANNTTNYANMHTSTGKIWGVVDGPWRLKTWNSATAAYSQVRNPSYGGQRPYAKGINYIPCQSSTGDCYNLLLSGKVDVAGLPSTFAKPITNLSQAKNGQVSTLAGKYHMSVGYSWSIGYSWMNQTSANTGASEDSALATDTTPRGMLFAQPYIARALNDSYPVQTIINTAYRGYAYSTFGPIPPKPNNSYTTLKSSPYALSKVAGEMTANGWTMVNGIYTCTSPGTGSGNCGAGIGKNATMTFRVDAAVAGDTQGQQSVTTWVSAAKTVGINLVPNIGTFDQVVAKDSQGATTWDMYTGSGWIFAPGFYPSGEPLFLTGAASNAGSFSNPTNDHNIIGTIVGNVSMDKYERFLTSNPPVVWNFWTAGLLEAKKNIGGYLYQATGYQTPELWYLK